MHRGAGQRETVQAGILNGSAKYIGVHDCTFFSYSQLLLNFPFHT